MILSAYLVTLSIPMVQAEGWDDFSNNLATDLAPFLSLFGEQVTKQYLSESTTFVDYFIFAMAPMGILTALVSAIRVCGSPSLRALIGRAQEGGGTAEAELCSSTSRDVCELYNNGGIARVFGRPKILEVIHDPDHGDFVDGTAGIYTLQEYLRGKGKDKWYRCSGKQRKGDAESDIKEESTITAFAPNLSLNIGIKKQHETVFWGVAFGGLILQTGVLVFAGTVTYYLKWGKDGSQPASYACPLVIAGTFLVCGGMFCCAFLVGQSTQEEVWRWKGTEDDKSSIHWVQPGGQVIGDQTFDAFSHSDCNHELKEYIISWKKKGSEKSEWAVWVVAGIIVSGFVLQFTGFRGIHSAVSVAQLGVVMAMGVARAALRMRRLNPDANFFASCPDEIIGHELDWLALHIGQDSLRKALASPSTDSSPAASLPPNMKCRYFWKFCGSPELAARILPGSSTRTNNSNVAAKLLAYRSRLAQLTASHSAQSKSRTSPRNFDTGMVEVRCMAQRLVAVIESTFNIIFYESAKIREEWVKEELVQWGINCEVSYKELSAGSAHPEVSGESQRQQHTIFLHLSRGAKDTDSLKNTWRLCNKLELEALLGLWLWSLKSDPAVETMDPDSELIISRATEIPASRIVSTDRKMAEHDLHIWLGGRSPNVIEHALQPHLTDSGDPSTIWTVNSEGVYQPLSDRLPERLDKRLIRFLGWYALDCPRRLPSEPLRLWTAPGNDSLLSQCAQEVFGSFLKCALGVVKDFGTVGIREEMPHFRLENNLVANVAESFTANELGSQSEAMLCILPAVLPRLGMPSSKSTLAAAKNSARHHRRQKKWQEAEGVLQWAWSICTAKPTNQDNSEFHEVTEQAAIELGELYRYALRDPRTRQFGSDGIEWLSAQILSGRYPPHDSLSEIIDRYRAIVTPVDSFGDNTNIDLLSIIKKRKLKEALVYLTHRSIGIPNTMKGKALFLAAAQGWSEVVLNLLELAAETDYKDQYSRTALSHAAQRGDVQTAKELIDWGAYPNSEDTDRRTPLSYASEAGQISVVEMLLADSRTFPDSGDSARRTPLLWAVQNGHNEITQLLLDKGADVNAKDLDEWTPLLMAAQNGHKEITQLLLDKGADVNAKDLDEWTPLLMAARNGHKEITQLLLDKGADASAKDQDGWTPLLWAAQNGHKEIMQLLLDQGADVNAKYGHGWTPLLWAAQNGHREIMQLLLEKGADVNAKEKDGMTPLLMAARNGHKEIMQQLLGRILPKVLDTSETISESWFQSRGPK